MHIQFRIVLSSFPYCDALHLPREEHEKKCERDRQKARLQKSGANNVEELFCLKKDAIRALRIDVVPVDRCMCSLSDGRTKRIGTLNVIRTGGALVRHGACVRYCRLQNETMQPSSFQSFQCRQKERILRSF